jgi:hypothetical protein
MELKGQVNYQSSLVGEEFIQHVKSNNEIKTKIILSARRMDISVVFDTLRPVLPSTWAYTQNVKMTVENWQGVFVVCNY